jgi:hypothetical protein
MQCSATGCMLTWIGDLNRPDICWESRDLVRQTITPQGDTTGYIVDSFTTKLRLPGRKAFI